MKMDEIGRRKNVVQITQRRPIRDRSVIALYHHTHKRRWGKGRTDLKSHFSWGSEPIPSQNSLSLAINSLIDVVTCSAV